MKEFLLISMLTCAVLSVRAAELDGQTDLAKAQAKAKVENKTVLLNFTGDFSWCGDCKNFEAEVLKHPEFQEYARTNLVVLELKEANKTLEEKYDVHAWPTLVLLSARGDTLHTKRGYRNGEGVKAVIDEIEPHRK